MALPDAVGLDWLNGAAVQDAQEALLACCSSPRWAAAMTTARPYADAAAVHSAAEAALAELSDADIADALSGHARIGERAGGARGAWSRTEQAGMSSASDDVARAMAEGNAAYEAKFGRVYLISAAGKSADELLTTLQARLANDPATERIVVRGELARINRLRLDRLLGPAPQAALQTANPTAPTRQTPRTTNLTTHVLDAATGRPAVGVPVELQDRAGTVLGGGRTDGDGRIKDLVSEPVPAGSYRLIFDTGAYHASVGTTGFYPEVVIAFTVTDSQQHHHVPLLLAPFAYSTYRGS